MKFLFFTTLVYLMSSFAMAQTDSLGKVASRNKNSYFFQIKCPVGKKTDDCFSQQESMYKKIGCDLDKEKCELMDQERNNTGSGSLLACAYRSSNCMVPENQTCDIKSKSKRLDGAAGKLVCVYDGVQNSVTYADCSKALGENKIDTVLSSEQIVQRLNDLLGQYESYGTSSVGQLNRRDAVRSKIMIANEKCSGLSNRIDSTLLSVQNHLNNRSVHAKPRNDKIRDTDLPPGSSR